MTDPHLKPPPRTADETRMRFCRQSVARCVLLAGLLPALVLGCAAPPGLPAADASIRAIEVEIVRLINAHRRARSLPPLQDEPLLAELARGHSGTMARNRARIGHDGLRRRFRSASAELPLTRFAENVARMRVERRQPASWAVSSWLGSRTHREHIEGPFGLTGVGVVRGADGDLYFTQLFAEAGEH